MLESLGGRVQLIRRLHHKPSFAGRSRVEVLRPLFVEAGEVMEGLCLQFLDSNLAGDLLLWQRCHVPLGMWWTAMATGRGITQSDPFGMCMMMKDLKISMP